MPDPIAPPRPHSQRRRRPPVRPGRNPDRVAMWAVVLGVLLTALAAASGHA